MAELIKTANLITQKISLLSKGRAIVKIRAEAKATACAEYDKQLALVIIRLKNGESMELEGKTIESPQATILEKIAKGIVWEHKLSMDKADALYKTAITNMNALTTEINALQSVLKYLDEVER